MKLKKLSIAAITAVLSAFFFLWLGSVHVPAGLSQSESIDSPQPAGSIFYGEPLPQGNGTFRSFIKFDVDGTPSDIGVTFSKAALSGLPNLSTTPSSFPAPTSLLSPLLPPEASATLFGDLELLYFNDGHTPDLPGFRDEHIDFSFFLPSRQERRSIICPHPDPTDNCVGEELAKVVKTPEPGVIPTGFEQVPPGSQFYAISGAGTTYSDLSGTYPLVASPFYGFSEGEMTFIDLLITNNFLENLDTQPNNSFTTTLAQPVGLLYPKDGYYPTSYSITYDGVSEYTVSLSGLTFRPSSPTSVP